MNTKPSAWLLDNVDSHDILPHGPLARSYEDAVGYPAPWQPVTVKRTEDAMKARGLGGSMPSKWKKTDLVAWGYLVAEHVARELIPGYVGTALGRGTLYREAVNALRKAGL